MDELKLRLEFLEHVSHDAESDQALLNQIDEIGATLDTMVGVRQNEVNRMATEVSKQKEIADPNEPAAEVKEEALNARYEDLSRLADELDMYTPLEVPEPAANQSIEERSRSLIEKASQLGRDFDELTVRSTELCRKLVGQVSEENTAVGDAEQAHEPASKPIEQ